jgi:hypothetical protein
VYKTECSYNVEALDTARRKIGAKQEESSAAELLLAQLRSANELEAQELLSQIRTSDENPDAIAESLRWVNKTPRKNDDYTLEGEYSQFHSEPKLGLGRYGLTSNLGFVPTEDCYHKRSPLAPGNPIPTTWTEVTTDVGFIAHLLRLYFTWSNAFYALVHEEAFYHDMENGETNHCSSLLMNTICAYACHFTDIPSARKDPQDPTTAGDHFFEAAKLQLFNDEVSCLTTVQALALMGIREISAGRDSIAFGYAGRSLRMAIELGMHLESAASGALTDSEISLRNRVFWGLFTYDA